MNLNEPQVKCLQNLVEKLKGQCNRYENGECFTVGCLQRGGYKSGDKVDSSKATCEAHEEVLALTAAFGIPAGELGGLCKNGCGAILNQGDLDYDGGRAGFCHDCN